MRAVEGDRAEEVVRVAGERLDHDTRDIRECSTTYVRRPFAAVSRRDEPEIPFRNVERHRIGNIDDEPGAQHQPVLISDLPRRRDVVAEKSGIDVVRVADVDDHPRLGRLEEHEELSGMRVVGTVLLGAVHPGLLRLGAHDRPVRVQDARPIESNATERRVELEAGDPPDARRIAIDQLHDLPFGAGAASPRADPVHAIGEERDPHLTPMLL